MATSFFFFLHQLPPEDTNQIQTFSTSQNFSQLAAIKFRHEVYNAPNQTDCAQPAGAFYTLFQERTTQKEPESPAYTGD